MLEKIEQRFMEWSDLDVSTETREDGVKTRSIKGYAATFNKLSHNLGGYKEQIERGAFSESVKGDIVALWNHNTDIVLGRSGNQSLSLEEDDRGLKFSLSLGNDSWSDYAYEKINRGDVKGMSFGFRIPPKGDEWKITESKELIRTLKRVSLLEVSPTVFPAYPSTSVSARSIRSVEEVLKEGEELIRAEGAPAMLADKRARRLRMIVAGIGRCGA